MTGTVLVNVECDIWALPVDGGEMTPLVTDPGADYRPKVSPDGRWLMFQTPWDVGRNDDVFPAGLGRDNHIVFVDQLGLNESWIAVILNWTRLLDPD